MKDQELDADAALLLRELRLSAPPESLALGRVRQRLAVSLTAQPIAAFVEPAASTSAPRPAAHASHWLAGSKAGMLATLVLGTGLGALGYSLVRAPVVRVEYRDRAVARSTASDTALSLPPVALPGASAEPAMGERDRSATPAGRREASPQAATSAVQPQASVDSEGLAAELRLLEKARSALSAGDADGALAALSLHAKRHTRGVLEQEREALRVKTLVGAGRFAEARRAGQRFIERYPESALLDSVSAALRSIP